jgi:N-dimethylarginine dimethylaminohydrolase
LDEREMGTIQSRNEWDPLREVVVGNTRNARYPFRDISSLNAEYAGQPAEALPVGPFPDWAIEESEEDLARLAATLAAAGVKVVRPETCEHGARLSNQIWEAEGFYNYCPRDILLVIDDLVIETPNAVRGRYHEALAYRSLIMPHVSSGGRYIAAPKPRLDDSAFAVPAARPVPANGEPIFDAANVMRFDGDLLYLLSSTGNELGAQWLQAVLGGAYRVHTCELDYYGSHIDTSIVPLRPGLLLCNPERVRPDMLPDFLKSWDLIFAPEPGARHEPREGYYRSCLASRWMGMNVLSISPDTVIVDEQEPALIKLLESRGLTAVPLPLRHSRLFGGGFHCVTLDLVRRHDDCGNGEGVQRPDGQSHENDRT